MKLSKKVIALLLVLSIALSVVVPISLTSGAATSPATGINATVYRVPAYVGDCLVEDSNEARVNYNNNKQFDASIDVLINASKLISGPSAVTATSTREDDWYITKWTGTMTGPTGEYTLIARKLDNGFVMFVNGQKVYEYWGASHWFDAADDRLISDLGTFTVEDGKVYDVEIYYLELGGGQALDVYATTTPDDLNSGTHINDVFSFDLTEEVYKTIHNDFGYFNDVIIGAGTGRDGKCEEANWKYEASIDKLLAKLTKKESRIVGKFSDAVVGEECYVIQYEGVMIPKTSGSYQFAGKLDNGFYLNIDGNIVYEFWAGATWNDGEGNIYPTAITLEAGKAYPFKAAFLETDGGQLVDLNAYVNNASEATSVDDLFTFYPTASALDFNLQAVNLLSGATTVDANSELTIQYTDATLGDDIEIYAQITDTAGNVLAQQQVGDDILRVENRNLFVRNEEPDVNKNIYSNAAGSVTFKPALTGTYNVSDLKVTIWTQSGTAGIFSNKATVTINNGFTNGTPDGLTGSNWMDYIDGATLLSQINMPGTHDATTENMSGLTSVSTKCQDTDIKEQLEMGVRYLDIRAYTKNADVTKENTITVNGEVKTISDFGLSHASYESQLDNGDPMAFSDIYAWSKEFLTNNPSETIVMVVNDENQSDRAVILNALHTFVNADPALFYTKTTEVPTLDDVRGKIVVMRRFPDSIAGDSGFIDFFWQDNCEGTEHPIVPVSTPDAVTTYFVQDKYEGVIASEKFDLAESFLNTAKANKKANQYYINFFSLAGLPKSNADSIKPKFKALTLDKAQYGYLLFDFIDAEICQKVYNTNMFTSVAQSTQASNNKVLVHYDFANVENNIVADAANNGFDGTMVNGGYLSANSIYNTVTFNNAGKTGTGAGHISIPQGVFRGTGNTSTVQVWMKATVEQNKTNLFTMGTYNYFVALTRWDNDGPRVAFATQKTANNARVETAFNASQQFALNEWNLLTYVFDGASVQIYMNDTLITTGTVNANFNDIDAGIFSDNPLLLGAASVWPDPGFIGSMGDFTIYNYAVDTNEIATTYADLAEEYTYILKATLGGNIVAVASEEAADTYIDEQYTDAGSAIWFKVPSDYDVTNAKLALEIDGSKVEISTDGGATYADFDANATYDLSGDVVLKVTSLNGTRTKEYDVNVNGIVVKDYTTDELVAVYNELPILAERDGYLAIGYYDSAKAEMVATAAAGNTVYQRYIAVEKPMIIPDESKSIRVEGAPGIRFKADINRNSDFYKWFNDEGDYVYSEDSDFKFGMLIVPEYLLNGELTKDTDTVMDIEGKIVYNQNNEGYLQYTGVITSIPDRAIDMTLVARAYITYTFNGEKVTIYSDNTTEGSYLSVAKLVYPTANETVKAQLEAIFGADVFIAE